MRFNSSKFMFNNIHCSMKNTSLIWGDNDFIEYGLTYNSGMELDGVSWKSKTNTPETITLHIVYEKNGIAQVWTKAKIKEIESWLLTNDFAPFISDDDKNITYYLKAINSVRRFNPKMMGWLEIEFQPMNNCGYMKQVINLKNAARFLNMRNIPALTIVNQSDFDKPSYPVFEIKGLNGKVEFINTSTGVTFDITGNGNIVVDHKMKTIFDSEGNNLIANSNRRWMYFNKGENKLQVVGDCDVSITSYYEVRV